MTSQMVYFDTREAAAALGIKIRTVQRWVESGRLVPIKPTTGFVFTGDEIGRVSRLPRPKRGRRQPPSPQPGLFPRSAAS